MFSIIIPTLNEEKNLSSLLPTLKSLKDFEIIIADAGSKDRTVEIAKEYGCKVVKGGLPARGRNSGAKEAQGDVLFFIDADVKFEPEDFIDRSVDYFIKNNLGIASFPIFPAENNIYMNPVSLNLVYNYPQKIFKKSFSMGAMGIIVKKDIFEKVEGFDETISLAEDVYFVQQASRLGKFEIIPGVRVYMPLRRYRRDGYWRTGFKYLACALHMAFKGPVRKMKYEFDHYDKK